MTEDEMNQGIDKELRELDLFQPSMRFSRNTVEKIKAQTELGSTETGPVRWLPKVFVGSALTVIVLVFVVLWSQRNTLSEITITDQINQAALIVFGTLTGLIALLGMDRFFKKLILG